MQVKCDGAVSLAQTDSWLNEASELPGMKMVGRGRRKNLDSNRSL